MTWARGEDGAIVVRVVDPAGTAVNLTGKSLSLGLRVHGSSTPILIRTGVLTAPTSGEATFYLTAADTSDLTQSEPYRYDVWLRDESGGSQIVPSSFFIVLEVQTLPGDVPISPVTNGHVDSGGGASSGFAIDLDNYWITSTSQPSEETDAGMARRPNFDNELSGSVENLIAEITAYAAVTGGTGTVRVRVGGTRGVADGTLIASTTVADTSPAAIAVESSSFVRPSGRQLVKVTLENDTLGERTSIEEVRIAFRAA